ncbi:DUF4097 family beta strand repeat-containing protein [Chengkuizengella axinellae]|uniref:DUF4097 family beta strand repeat-containing protein n=1 Tax=Chengkuizengella axinellae TaxID=3064388 RepID=A0ABT9J5W1_9BACL|nr:DUF4097 family beta strand repeat-containing protein [Chengkuizengella sp. 2205SS18-9]MDP5276984.1 DUF4097 family beta strand repeat-containing protein [Chengkuizengella sp. 2205SS18-9]
MSSRKKINNEIGRGIYMVKVGRYTSALLLVLVGTALLIDQTRSTSYLDKIIEWWPVIIISFGVEYLWFQTKRNKGKDIKVDVKAVIISVMTVLILFGVTSGFPFLNQLDLVYYRSASENDIKFEKKDELITLSENTSKLYIENLNGIIELQPTEEKELKIETTVYVSSMDQENAKSIADESIIKWNNESASTFQVFAIGKEYYKYGLKYKPRINLIVHVPEGKELDIQLVMKNGSAIAADLSILNDLNVDTTNGNIYIANIKGNVVADTTNGMIEVYDIEGETVLDTTNGDIFAEDIAGDLIADTTNGRISGELIDGKVVADTTNGSIQLEEVYDNVTADTTNGSIKVKSGSIDGRWDLDTTNATIEIIVPENEDFSFRAKASRRAFSSDFPFQIDDSVMEGVVGRGEFKIEANTSNGSVSVKKLSVD